MGERDVTLLKQSQGAVVVTYMSWIFKISLTDFTLLTFSH